jgi:hypothetical protein
MRGWVLFIVSMMVGSGIRRERVASIGLVIATAIAGSLLLVIAVGLTLLLAFGAAAWD